MKYLTGIEKEIEMKKASRYNRWLRNFWIILLAIDVLGLFKLGFTSALIGEVLMELLIVILYTQLAFSEERDFRANNLIELANEIITTK